MKRNIQTRNHKYPWCSSVFIFNLNEFLNILYTCISECYSILWRGCFGFYVYRLPIANIFHSTWRQNSIYPQRKCNDFDFDKSFSMHFPLISLFYPTHSTFFSNPHSIVKFRETFSNASDGGAYLRCWYIWPNSLSPARHNIEIEWDIFCITKIFLQYVER